MSTETIEQRESPAGMHFIQLYKDCQWKWYLRYVLGYMTRHTKPAFIYGAAIHDARANWYQEGPGQGDVPAMIDTFRSVMERRKMEYFDADKFGKDLTRGPSLLKQWASDYGDKDLRRCDVLGVELQLNPVLTNGYQRTARFDTALRDRSTGDAFILEAKTTGFSYNLMIDSVFMGDQVTDYLWACQQCHPEWDVQYAIADVMYQKGSTVRCVRSPQIRRSQTAIDAYVKATVQTMEEMTSRVLGVSDTEHHPSELFTRNTGQCISHMSKCEYFDICRLPRLGPEPPPDFTKDPWRVLEDLGEVDEVGVFRLMKQAEQIKEQDTEQENDS